MVERYAQAVKPPLAISLAISLAVCALVARVPAQEPSWRQQFVTVDAPVIALTGVRLIDGTGAPAVDGQTILIEGGRIAAVGASIPVPAGAHHVDLQGKTVIPGLVMLHEHMMYFSGRAVWHAQPVSYPKLYLAAGVTTLRTGGTEHPEVDINLKRRIDEGFAAGPKMHLTGPYFNGAAGDFLGDTVVRTAEEGRAAAAYWAARGFTSLKLYDALEAPAARSIIDEAHARGVKVTGHLGAVGCAEAVAMGLDFIEHGFGSCRKDLSIEPDGRGYKADLASPVVRALIDTLVKAGTVLVITPNAPGQPLPDAELEMLHPQARETFLRVLKEQPPWLPQPDGLRELRKIDRAYVEAGGRAALGADAMDHGMIAGFANHRALSILTAEGWPALEVLKLATSNGAAMLGVQDSTGTIRAGLAADLIVVDGDPSVDMTALARIRLVFKDGLGYDPVKLRAAARGLVGWH